MEIQDHDQVEIIKERVRNKRKREKEMKHMDNKRSKSHSRKLEKRKRRHDLKKMEKYLGDIEDNFETWYDDYTEY